MKDEYLEKVVHNLTHRRFKGTSRQSIYQQGSSVSNSFYDPRNIGNYDSGEINPEGKYATHYPVNSASNTAGFAFGQEVDQGDDKRAFYPSQVYGNNNALEISKKKGGALGSSSSGSSSDYLYFNPYYAALLNPKNLATMNEVAQPHYIPYVYNSYEDGKMEGRGTNAPSSGSSVDYRMNNPYAFKSNFGGFTGGSLGASSSGSASDYYSSNPNRVPAIQSETRHYSDFMEGGKINWSKYLGYIKTGLKYAPEIIEKAPAIFKKGKETLDQIKELRQLLRPKKSEPPKETQIDYDEEPEDDFIKVSPRKAKQITKQTPKKKRVVKLEL